MKNQYTIPYNSYRQRVFLWLRIIVFIKLYLNRLPFFRHPHYTPFLVLSYHKSVAAQVHTALNSHPRILTPAEELRGYFNLKKGAKQIKKFFKVPLSRLVQALGYKLFYEDAYSREGLHFWKYWRKKQRPVIHLQQRNLLRIVVCEEIAAQQQQGAFINHQQEGNVISLPTVEIIPQILMQRMAHLENLQQVFSQQLKSYPRALSVWYEDLLEAPEQQFKAIQQFLGVTPRPLYSLLEVQNPAPLSALLSNYEEIKLFLKGNKWEVFLD